MRFIMLAIIDLIALVVSIGAAIATALAGFRYWALVVMTMGQPMISLLGVWMAAGWMPGMPTRRSGIWPMLRYGGTITLNTVVVYLAYNAEKVLLGRFWGAETLGLYGRAYQLINLPTENLNSTIGGVAFPALCRVQNEPSRLRSYFLKGYSLFLSLVMPVTMGCALFADDIIRVALGAKWHEAAPVFRLLAPTILAFALINPFAWLMLATNHAGRSLRIAFLIAPVVILGYLTGLSHGPRGVAAGFSMAMVILIAPVILWAKQGTLITGRDIVKTVMTPLLAIGIAAAVTIAAGGLLARVHLPLLRLIIANSVMFGVYGLVLLFGLKQKAVYIELLRQTGIWRFGARRSSEVAL
jgi:PST family polysaccharide transporter